MSTKPKQSKRAREQAESARAFRHDLSERVRRMGARPTSPMTPEQVRSRLKKDAVAK